MSDQPRSWSIGGLLFSCDFESGNIGRIVSHDNNRTFHLWIRPDNAGTPHENNNRTWFYFSVAGAKKGQLCSFVIMNMNPQMKLYADGYRIMHRTEATSPKWSRIPSATQGMIVDDQFLVKFRYRFEYDKESVYFAFCYPYTYSDLQSKLSHLDQQAHELSSRHIFYSRRLLALSLLGNRIDMIVITSKSNVDGEMDAIQAMDLEGLSTADAYPTNLRQKPVIFLTARVHPGETPSSFVIDGSLSFALHPSDPRAVLLRENYIIVLIPMLNPDGVILGNYRTDTLGANLNRYYDNPHPQRHPSIYAVCQAFLHFHYNFGIKLYVDCHGHAAKKGCFMYGNFMECEQQFASVISYCKILALNTPYFEIDQCNFSRENMHSVEKNDSRSKDSCGRVALYYKTRTLNCYTLECNYNGAKELCRVPNLSGGTLKESDISHPQSLPVYTPASWTDVGKAILISVLDMDGLNPYSRLCNSEFGDASGVRRWTSKYGRSKIGLMWDSQARSNEDRNSHQELHVSKKIPDGRTKFAPKPPQLPQARQSRQFRRTFVSSLASSESIESGLTSLASEPFASRSRDNLETK